MFSVFSDRRLLGGLLHSRLVLNALRFGPSSEVSFGDDLGGGKLQLHALTNSFMLWFKPFGDSFDSNELYRKGGAGGTWRIVIEPGVDDERFFHFALTKTPGPGINVQVYTSDFEVEIGLWHKATVVVDWSQPVPEDRVKIYIAKRVNGVYAPETALDLDAEDLESEDEVDMSQLIGSFMNPNDVDVEEFRVYAGVALTEAQVRAEQLGRATIVPAYRFQFTNGSMKNSGSTPLSPDAVQFACTPVYSP